MKRRRTREERQADAREALHRAQFSQALTNYPAIYQGFVALGITVEEIRPRENVFTFDAWKTLGRHVRKGEHGVQVVTWIQRGGEIDPETGETKGGYRFPKTTTVFHVSQTDANEVENAAA